MNASLSSPQRPLQLLEHLLRVTEGETGLIRLRGLPWVIEFGLRDSERERERERVHWCEYFQSLAVGAKCIFCSQERAQENELK
jgi:hypothetical protein